MCKFFHKAEPIRGEFPPDCLNQSLIFVTEIPGSRNCIIRLTASSQYRLKINGGFVGYGPARTAHNYSRVDEYNLDGFLTKKQNLLTVEVFSYQVANYCYPLQDGFFQAEVTVDDNPIAYTAIEKGSFKAFYTPRRLEKVQRYSYQRGFVEDYDLTREEYGAEVKLEKIEKINLLERHVDYASFREIDCQNCIQKGILSPSEEVFEDKWINRSGLTLKEDEWALGGYKRKDLESALIIEASGRKTENKLAKEAENLPITLSKEEFATFDMQQEYIGFILSEVSCSGTTRILFVFDEIMCDNRIDLSRYQCVNIVGFTLGAGVHKLETIEPYSFRYLQVFVLSGTAEIKRIGIREYANRVSAQETPYCKDKEIDFIYRAAFETFRQNAVDILTDCPGRERAGWLCDSFFTARAEKIITGKTLVEDNFLENFMLAEESKYLPKGMIQCLYPGDFPNKCFIPTWTFWLILELAEYKERGGRLDIIKNFQPKIEGLFEYFRQLQNSDGLLENLEGWVFVEWSCANDYVQDVNYPCNMMYAYALEQAGKLYNNNLYLEKAEKLKQKIIEQSFDGTFFADHAVRKNGKLEVQKDYSEVCQYYAFYTQTATFESHAELWGILKSKFGPNRCEEDYPYVGKAAPFIGYFLRLELLSQAGLKQEILSNIKSYYLYMAETTGTLWEFAAATASCNHGFASHLVYVLNRDFPELIEK